MTTDLPTIIPAKKCERESPHDRGGGTLQQLRDRYAKGEATWARYTKGREGARLFDSDGLVLGRIFPAGSAWGYMIGTASGTMPDPQQAMTVVERFLSGGER